MNVLVRVPATSANLGPGFDTLGLALSLWNEVEFAPAEAFYLHIAGEGAARLRRTPGNLIVRSARKVYRMLGREMPPLRIRCLNRIPPGAGLGSSSAAILSGLLGANALLGNPLSPNEILNLASAMEGHADNVAPALLGGLVVAALARPAPGLIARKLPIRSCAVTVVLPEVDFPTAQARAILPKRVALEDAVHNIGRAVLVCEALRLGDLDLLGRVMEDALHQRPRLRLIPGASEALRAARQAGAAAVALSGAGPGLIAFSSQRAPAIGSAMRQAFEAAGARARLFDLQIARQGAQVIIRE